MRHATIACLACFLLVLAACGSGAGGTVDPGTDPGSPDVVQDPGADIAINDNAQPDPGGEDVPADGTIADESPADAPAPDGIEDVPPDAGACATCTPCQTCLNGKCVDIAPTFEEQAIENGSFGEAVVVPLGKDFLGYIGNSGDVDWFRFCVTEPGVVTLKLDFADSFDAQGILSMLAAVYTETWLQSNLGVAMSDATKSDCKEYENAKICPKSALLRFSVDPAIATEYRFNVSGGGDGEVYAGFDTKNPYTLRLDFLAGAGLEADQPDVGESKVGAADSWNTAYEVVFPAGDRAMTSVQSYVWHWNDIDWYRFRMPKDGWVRIGADLTAIEDNDSGTFLMFLDGTLYRMTDAGPVDVGSQGLSFSAGDSPNCALDWEEVTDVKGGADYYLRVAGMPSHRKAPYKLVFEYGAGDPESDQPDVDGKHTGSAEEAFLAYDVGTVSAEAPITVGTYTWHVFDYDWFRVTAPASAGTIEAVVDFSKSYAENGWWLGYGECTERPNGIQIWSYAFTADDLTFPGIAQGYENDVPSQTLSWAADAGKDYYLLVLSREMWDPTNPYTVTFTFKPPVD